MSSQRDKANDEQQNDRYLWDGSGQPDPEIQRLESLLAQFRHNDAPLTLPLPQSAPAEPSKFRAALLHMPWLPRLAAAAVVVLALIAAGVLSFLPSSRPPAQPGWAVERLDGTPQIGTHFMSAELANGKLEVGQTLVTNGGSRASISDIDLGEIKVDANSRVRLLQSDTNHKRIQLEVGTIHAAIWAPAGQFVVETPSAVAVDLGCAYTLHVAPDGSGTIRTTLGWVGFHLNGHESFIPAGAMCPTRPSLGPGTPYFEDASDSFRAALAELDFGSPSPDSRAAALHTILSQAREKDALTLWHLLSRTSGPERVQVFNRFADLVPPPAGVTREGVLALDQPMLDLWWNSLHLGDMYLWRYWEQSDSPRVTPNDPAMKKQQLLQKTP